MFNPHKYKPNILNEEMNSKWDNQSEFFDFENEEGDNVLLDVKKEE